MFVDQWVWEASCSVMPSIFLLPSDTQKLQNVTVYGIVPLNSRKRYLPGFDNALSLRYLWENRMINSWNLNWPTRTMVKHRQAPSALLLQELINLLLRKGVPLQDGLRGLIPRHWEIFNDLILFPASAFEDDVWATVKPEIWECVAAVFKVSRVARHGRVLPNNFRSPQVEMLRGTNPWVRKKDNGVIYELDITKSMFSQGNITEKLRMSKLDCRGEVVVDLFAGIGYFTIPLIKAGAEKVYACEWSPDAVSALKRNVVLNHAEERCVVLFGDNRQVLYPSSALTNILALVSHVFHGKSIRGAACMLWGPWLLKLLRFGLAAEVLCAVW